MAPPEKQETDMNEITEIRELSMDDLEAVSGGITGREVVAGVLGVIGDVAHALGANDLALKCYNTAYDVLTPK
jgi:hypothetical protein